MALYSGCGWFHSRCISRPRHFADQVQENANHCRMLHPRRYEISKNSIPYTFQHFLYHRNNQLQRQQETSENFG